MAIRTRFEPIDRDIAAIIARDLSPEAESKALASFARERLAEADAQNAKAFGFPPPHETYVDGRKGAPLESVRPRGTILFEFELLVDLFEWIEAQLILNSPVRTGRFARSFVFFIDGVEADPKRVPRSGFNEAVFLNTTEYARKIERGLSKQSPDGVFEAVATLAKRRFGNIAKVRFSYRSPISPKSHVDRTPAIVITV
jgi:hypothetical protein